MARSKQWLAWCSLAFALGCGSPHPQGPSEPPELSNLSEARALELIGEVLAEEGVPRAAGWSIEVAPEVALNVDVRLASSSFGIEWVSPQDRIDMGEAIPQPAAGGQLRIVPGLGDDASAQVLVLESASYRYSNDRTAVQSGAPGASETEGRLRRDVRDFLQYVRGQGGP